jgi:hypothetical protein
VNNIIIFNKVVIYMAEYVDGLTNNERGIILEDVYKGQMAKVVIPTLTPSADTTKATTTKVAKPSQKNVVSGVDLGLQKYVKCNYIELQAPQKFYKGDAVTVSTIDDYEVEDMTITGEYNE